MWLGELHPEAWDCVVAAQRQATALGHKEMRSDHLLLGLLEDEPGAVGQALRESGIGVADVRAALAAVPDSQLGPSETTLRPTDETEAILERALSDASAREHVNIEQGHLLLAIADEPTCLGRRVLLELGADLGRLRARLVETLPRKSPDNESLRRYVEQFPRLTADETRELVSDVRAWREANRLMREDATLGPAEKANLELVRADTREAWLRLQNHHLYLAWTAAQDCAHQGHDLVYGYNVARHALTGACFSLDFPEGAVFADYAAACIANAMERTLGCVPTDRSDLQPDS